MVQHRNKLSPDRQFGWCLRSLERLFDVIHQNIFRDDGRFSIGFFVILFVFVLCLSMQCYTIANYERDITYGATIVFFGIFQVYIWGNFWIRSSYKLFLSPGALDFPQVPVRQ